MQSIAQLFRHFVPQSFFDWSKESCSVSRSSYTLHKVMRRTASQSFTIKTQYATLLMNLIKVNFLEYCT